VQHWKFWQEMFILTVVFSKLQQITSNMSLEDSFDFTPLNYDDDEDDNNESLLNNLNFEKFSPPALLTRHSPSFFLL
jgi:hypothetical protein